MDQALTSAIAQVDATPAGGVAVRAFFDEATSTASYVVHDPLTAAAAVIDAVLDFDAAAGRTSSASADAIIAFVRAEGLRVEWLLETHVHADHLSAAPYLQRALGGGCLAIGTGIVAVQATLGKLFGVAPAPEPEAGAFDRLFDDGASFAIGGVPVTVLHVPGHTPADVAYVVGDAAFVGDTLFMPDYGTARADFPGGDARTLYRSIRRLLALPERTRLFTCHDYKAPGRDDYRWESTVAGQRAGNVHVHDGIDEDAFVAMREARDATLAMPRLILPSIQVNLRGGRLPEPDANGLRYLRIPLDAL